MTEVNVNGIRFRGLIDTGACASLLSEEIAIKLGMMAYPVNLEFLSVDLKTIQCTSVPYEMSAQQKKSFSYSLRYSWSVK